MPWNLAIHHIDVGQGESTLLVAMETNAAGGPIRTRTMLIDGGLYVRGNIVNRYINSLGIANINVIVATHYDKDHFNGLRYLIRNGGARYNNTLIVDQGEQGNVGRFGNIANRDSDYIRYVKDIEARGLTRLTNHVTSSLMAPSPPWVVADWLIGQELLWRDGAGAVIPIPANAPTVTCIAVNQYIRRNDGTSYFVFGGLSADTKNAQSIGLIVRFNNFRYYTAGDLESTQEDQVGNQLNLTGGVNAFKAGHHGSEYSTSVRFIRNLQPSAAFISCGAINSFNGVNHPTQQTINNIDGSPTVQNYYFTACGYPRNHVPASQSQSQLVARARVAGGVDTATNTEEKGNIILRLTEAQSRMAPARFDVTYWEEEAHINPGVGMGQGAIIVNH